MSHCLLVLKQCLWVEIFMTNTNIVEFYFNNIQYVNYVIFKNIQQHCFPVYIININKHYPPNKMKKNIHGPPLRPSDLEPNSRSIRVSFLKAPNMPPTAPLPPRRGKNQWAKSSCFFRRENGEPQKTYGDLWGHPVFFKESQTWFRMLLIWSVFVEKVSVSLRLDVFWKCVNMFCLFLCSTCVSFVCNVLMCLKQSAW